MSKASIGLCGLGVMGANLARNIESRGYSVAVYNRTSAITEKFAEDYGDLNFVPSLDIKDFVASLERPRKIILMVKAGGPTDAVIDGLIPLLDEDDILIDAGNAWFEDTQRREKYCEDKKINFLGIGVSGGEEGALKGPSIMPGGPRDAWEKVSEILTKIAAVAEGDPCTNYIGPDGSGHFVKMVHNGIEYADMQLIAECYHLLVASGIRPPELAEIFNNWNEGVLSSFLIEITSKIFTVKDSDSEDFLVDQILDRAGQKGTGQWTAEIALSLGIPVPTINAAVNARSLSSFKAQRVAAAKILSSDIAKEEIDPQLVHDALYAAKIIAYAQGMALMEAASKEYNWGLNLGEIAALWRGGCIIRARFLNDITNAYVENPELDNLILSDFMSKALAENIEALREVVARAAKTGVPVLALSSALAYYDSYRLADLPQNLTQAQRDFFGAHTYERKDREGVFHTEWES